jgi:hypothetical protein
MRYLALFALALMWGTAPATAAPAKTQHCTLTSLNDARATSLFGGTGPYEFDIVIERPNQIDAKATAASLSTLAQGEVRERWVSPGGLGFKFHASARDGRMHWFGVDVNHSGDVGHLTYYGQAGRNPIGPIFRVRCDRLNALNGRF